MKFIHLLVYVLLISSNVCAQAQTLFTYGNNTVSKEEFLRAFLKNNTEKQPAAQAYHDYLDLYARFKIKVRAAYDLKMDTLPNQVAELADFRNQVAASYLNDETSFQNLVQEAFTRSQKDIHLAHIFIAFDSAGNNATSTSQSQDTAKAWRLAGSVYKELQKGTAFNKLAASHSSDPSALYNGGDIGYITVFTLPYALENVAYSLPAGKFSQPFRSSSGYHIFKNLGERKAAGKMKIAQLFIAFPPDTISRPASITKQKADSIYNLLIQGTSFSHLVSTVSDDINSRATKGEMPEFGVGSFDPRFEEAVFALEKNGGFTKPILTAKGYYIITRLHQTPVNTDLQNDSALALLRQLVQNDARMELARKALVQKLFKVTGFSKAALPENALLSYAENTLRDKKTSTPATINHQTVVFSFPHQQVRVSDLIKFIQEGRYFQNGKLVQNPLPKLEETMVREYYRDHLEEYNADFAAQVKEFREGNLLFEIMQRTIWDRASVDSVGLKNFFDRNQIKYWWNSSVDAVVFSAADTTTAVDLRSRLSNHLMAWRNIVSEYQTGVQADSGRFEVAQLPLRQIPAPGMLTMPLKASEDSSTSFIHIIKVYPANQPRNYEDAKGFVLNDYQDHLEKEWIDTLKKKYPVKINEPVLRSLSKTP